MFPYLGGNGNTKIIEASKFYPKGAWRWEFVGRGRNVSRRCWVPGPLPRVLSCLLPVEGLPRAGHVPGMDVSVSSLSYTAMPGSNLARQAAEHIFHPSPTPFPSHFCTNCIRLSFPFDHSFSKFKDSVWWTSESFWQLTQGFMKDRGGHLFVHILK